MDNNLFDFTSPYINLAVEQATGRSTLTGLPIEKRGVSGSFTGLVSGLPAFTIVTNAYKSYAELNALRGNENPEDIFQETFIKVIKSLRKGKYQEKGIFVSWVIRIAHNLIIDHFRRNSNIKRNNYYIIG